MTKFRANAEQIEECRLLICEYLGITPQEFFDEENTYPILLQAVIDEARFLDPEPLEYILGIMKELNGKKK